MTCLGLSYFHVISDCLREDFEIHYHLFQGATAFSISLKAFPWHARRGGEKLLPGLTELTRPYSTAAIAVPRRGML